MRASDLTDVLAEAVTSVCSSYALFGLVYFMLLINVSLSSDHLYSAGPVLYCAAYFIWQ